MKTVKHKKAFFTTKWLTYTAVLTALVIATSAIPPIYIPGLEGGIYWCDGIILIASYLLDPLAAFICGGVGSLLYDLWLGKPATMVVSLIIHGLQAATVSALLHYAFRRFKREALWAGVASFVGAIIITGGYFLYYWLVAPIMFGGSYGLAYGAVRIPRNIIQEIIGITIAMVICYATTFKKQLEKNGLLPDFKREVLQKQPAPQSEATES